MHSGVTHERCADFRHGKKKKQKRGEFITPPRPTGRRSNYISFEFGSRYITVLYFLNHVEEGGETAFPIADNATANSTVRKYVKLHELNTVDIEYRQFVLYHGVH